MPPDQLIIRAKGEYTIGIVLNYFILLRRQGIMYAHNKFEYCRSSLVWRKGLDVVFEGTRTFTDMHQTGPIRYGQT